MSEKGDVAMEAEQAAAPFPESERCVDAEDHGDQADSPASGAVDITPDQDGGVLKEIKKEGVGQATPNKGDRVSVHYVGTLTDGTKFDSSRDRDQYFEFNLGKSEVIKAWDLGVATMKKGELAVLTCKSEYAYGEKGSPPKIPPNATLVFEVELISWIGDDLSEKKDGGIVRTLLEKGQGYQNPKEDSQCDVHIIGWHDGREFENRNVNFYLGDGAEVGVVPGIEQALKKFIKKEKSRLEIKSKYAYGEQGNEEYKIPPNADLVYEVTLNSFEKLKESWEMDAGEKLEQAGLVKDKGTNYFKQGKFPQALRHYKRIIDYLEQETSLEGEEADKKKALLLAGHLNIAMCHLKLQSYLDAVHACNKALELDPTSEKGLFRRGMGHLNLKDYEDSVKDFKAVLEVDANNKAAKTQLGHAQQKIKAEKEKERKTYAGMFQKFAEIDAKKEVHQPEAKSQPEAKPEADVNSTSDSSEGEETPSGAGDANAPDAEAMETEPVQSPA